MLSFTLVLFAFPDGFQPIFLFLVIQRERKSNRRRRWRHMNWAYKWEIISLLVEHQAILKKYNLNVTYYWIELEMCKLMKFLRRTCRQLWNKIFGYSFFFLVLAIYVYLVCANARLECEMFWNCGRVRVIGFFFSLRAAPRFFHYRALWQSRTDISGESWLGREVKLHFATGFKSCWNIRRRKRKTITSWWTKRPLLKITMWITWSID